MASVFLGNITSGAYRIETVKALLETKGSGIVEYFALKQHGPYLDTGRNAIIESFLEQGQDWLVFFDSDIVWQPPQIEQLVESADPQTRPVVSGVYFSPLLDEVKPILYRWVDGQFQQLTKQDLDDAPDDLVQVDACGAGFLAIHRDLLLKMQNEFPPPTPWFAEVPVNGIQCGEDLTFCARLAKMGVPVYANRAVTVGHIKQMMF